ncbi:MAG: 23S rRNA (adenine(2030)-N(6))-methyltransferase RlmJ [Variibacter sp.]|nr:23S rRNA (adenine(2030)-N(6))-methyltransferase RlmJ [Variibacter sp.]
MNYRHAFHAGNFADVHKHATLARILTHLREKAAAFRVIDTHAGAGRYDLAGEEAGRTGEWRNGVARILSTSFAPPVSALLAPYLDALGGFDPQRPALYPGSPVLALALMRPQDRLIACELEPTAAAQLEAHLARDKRAKAIRIDGWTALTAYVPPKERRGLVLIDPPFEQPDEFAHAGERLLAAYRRWPTGIFMLWYPLKEAAGPAGLAGRLASAGMPNVLRSELWIGPADGERLAGSGIVVINPPWRLKDELAKLAPALADAMGRPGAPRPRLDWIAEPK